MKKVYITQREPIELVVILLMVFFLGFIVYLYVNIQEFGLINLFCCIMWFLFPMAGLASVFFTTIKENSLICIKLTQIEIIFTVHRNKKDKDIHIKLSDIDSCSLQIYSRIDPNNYSRYGNKDICILTFVVKDKQGIEQTFSSDNLDTYWMKNLFSIAKYIPNFSYIIDSNTDIFKAEVESFSKKGEGLSLKDYFACLFSDKSVSKDKKIYIKFLFCILGLWLLFLIFLISLLITDILK